MANKRRRKFSIDPAFYSYKIHYFLQSKIYLMPNKKYKYCSHSSFTQRRCRKQQTKCISWVAWCSQSRCRSYSLPELYSKAIISVKVLIILPLQNHYTALFIAFSVLAKKELGVLLFLLRKKNGWIYHNSAYIIDKMVRSGIIPKMHIPDDPHFTKKFYFTQVI
jgi:hypothetical protein